jgi:HlyD family secretion protein
MLLGLLLMIAAGGAVWWFGQTRDQTEKRYRTEKLDRGGVTQTVSANGTLNPVKLVNVGTQVSGTVKKLNVDYNDRVEVGQVLMVLDDALFAAAVRQSEAALANAQATLSLAQANVSRIEALFMQEFVSRQEMDEARKAAESARAGVAQARAVLDRDRINLSNTVIRSPVSGVVVSREVDVGQTVAASFQTPTLFRIAQDLTKMQIDSSFAEADVGQIKVGQSVRFRVDAFPDRQFSGNVRQVRLNPTTVQNVVTYNVVVAVENPDYRLLPGMTAYVTVEVASREDVWRIPNAALRFKPAQAAPSTPAERRGGRAKGEANRATVHVLRGGDVVPVPVVIGISNGRYTEFVSGEIKPEDALVVEDLSLARDKPTGGPQPAFRMRMF